MPTAPPPPPALGLQQRDLLRALTQHGEGARHGADFVAALGVGNLDLRVARGDAVHRLPEIEQRARDRALGEEHGGREGGDQGREQQNGEDPLDLPGEAGGLLGERIADGLVALGEGDEVVVQGTAIGAVQIGVALLVRRSGRDLAAEPDRLGAEGDELIDRFLHLEGRFALRRRHTCDEIGRELAHHREARLLRLGERFRLLRILRHVDAARIHHDSEDLRVDPFGEQGDLALHVRAVIEILGTGKRVESEASRQHGTDGDNAEHRQYLEANRFHCVPRSPAPGHAAAG